MQEGINPVDVVGASVGVACGHREGMTLHGHYDVVCKDENGIEVWRERVDNLVTTVGKNNALDNHLGATGYTATWFPGLISATGYGAGPAAGDTAASHPGWTESTAYSNATRPAATWAAASGGSKSLSAPVDFNINGPDTIKGCFLISNSTKGGSTGVLYSAGLFSTGDKPVAAGYTLSVSYTANA